MRNNAMVDQPCDERIMSHCVTSVDLRGQSTEMRRIRAAECHVTRKKSDIEKALAHRELTRLI